MSIHNSDPWFGRGTTLGVSDVNQGTNVTGTIKVFNDVDPRSNVSGRNLSYVTVMCKAVRNTSGAALLPGTIVKMASSDILNSSDGAASAAPGLLGVVDEYLPSTGVAANDVFWMVISGPTTINTAATLSAGAAISVGSSTTAGKAVAASATDKSDIIGYAISAAASNKVRTLVGIKSAHSAS